MARRGSRGDHVLDSRHLVGLFVQRELHPVEPHVGEALLASDATGCAPEGVDVERQRGVEVGNRERQVEERLHALAR